MVLNEINDYKLTTVKVYDTKYDSEEANKGYDPVPYHLPDGYNFEVSVDEQYSLTEPFFDTSYVSKSSPDQDQRSSSQPSLPAPKTSYVQQILSSIEKCDIDVRSSLLNTIILAGGNTLIPNFTERIVNDLNEQASHLRSALKQTVRSMHLFSYH